MKELNDKCPDLSWDAEGIWFEDDDKKIKDKKDKEKDLEVKDEPASN